MRKLEPESVSAVVTDPPYGLKFMGKDWDDAGEGAQQQEWHRRWLAEAYRVLVPGGLLAAFAGSRTYHHLACAAEDVGFEIRDQIMWLYGSGFPKSLDVSKAIDKQRYDKPELLAVVSWFCEQLEASGVKRSQIDQAFGTKNIAQGWFNKDDLPGRPPAIPTLDQIPLLLEVLDIDPVNVPKDIARLIYELNGPKGQPGDNWFKREIVEKKKSSLGGTVAARERDPDFIAEHKDKEFAITAPATEQAAQWEGWGTALKPAHEPILLAAKQPGQAGPANNDK